MNSEQKSSSTPRSAGGFALAITLALFTFWAAGLVVQVYSYVVEPPVQSAAAPAPQSSSCPAVTYDAVPCEPATRQP